MAAPDGWVDPPQVGFDWDGDGAPDTLGFDQDAGAIVVTWADGSLTVTGVRSDFTGQPGQPVEPGGDPFLEQPSESGPPSEEAVEAGLAAPVPAAVADVTGGGPQDPILTGYPNDTFRPEGRVSRATFVNMLRRWKTTA